jgi:Fur family ferric uptake transcriptional regulator
MEKAGLRSSDTDILLAEKGVKPTPMRKLVYEVLLARNSAMSLYEIEQQFDNVERSTIYRALKVFQGNSLVHTVYDGTGAVRYALCEEGCQCSFADQHVHFLCNQCGQSYCLRALPVPQLELPEGFDFEGAHFVVTGTCPNCG